MRTMTVVLGLLLVAAAACRKSPVSGALAEYQVLSIPRERLPLGDIWLASGPAGTSTLPDSLLDTLAALTEGDIAQSGSFSGALSGSLSGALGLDVGGSTATGRRSRFRFSGMRIVEIKSLSSLDVRHGVRYLVGGVVLDSFDLHDSTIATDTVRSRLRRSWGITSADVTAETRANSTIHVSVRGNRLFVGYRMIEFIHHPIREIAREHFASPAEYSSSLAQGSYRLRFRPRDTEDMEAVVKEGREVWPPLVPVRPITLCSAVMEAELLLERSETGAPAVRRWPMRCAGSSNEDGRYRLYTALRTSGPVIDELVLRDLRLVDRQGGGIGATGSVSIERDSFTVRPVRCEPPGCP